MNRLKLKHFSIYRSVSAFVLALFMILSVTLVSYAVGVGLNRAEAFKRVSSQNPNIVFSDFFAVGNRVDGGHDYVFVDSAVYPSDSFFCIVEDVAYVNGNPGVRGRAAYISSDGTVSYISGAFTRNIVQNSDGSWGSYTVCMEVLYNTCYGPVDIADTNIPIFLSENDLKSYYFTGDTTGLKNLDQCFLYDSSIEAPQNLEITYSTDKLFMDDGSCDFPDFKFEWKQSDDANLGGYKTEIYMQCTLVNPNLESIIRHDYSDSKLSDKIELKTINTQRQNSVVCEWEKYSSALYDESVRLHGYTPGTAIVVAPIFFWVRNVKGNSYGDWIRVKVTSDNVAESGTSFNGVGTVTGGYEKIDGENGEYKDDGEYGNSYYVDVKTTENFIGRIRQGFGLLGDSGIFGLMQAFFSFLPHEYFDVLIAYTAAAASVSLFLLFLKR